MHGKWVTPLSHSFCKWIGLSSPGKCCYLAVLYWSGFILFHVLGFAYIWLVLFLFLLKIRIFFLNSSLNWRCVWALEKEPVDEETQISCSDTRGVLLFVLQPEAWTISQQNCLGVYQKQQKRIQLKVYVSFAKSFSSLPEQGFKGMWAEKLFKTIVISSGTEDTLLKSSLSIQM